MVDKEVVNTNQILGILFGPKEIKDKHHMMMVLFFSGAVRVQEQRPKEKTLWIEIPKRRWKKVWWVFNLRAEDTDDKGILESKSFFRSIFIAFALNKKVIISL